jgi:hypothetical protein
VPDQPIVPTTYTLSGTLSERTAQGLGRLAGAEVVIGEFGRLGPLAMVVSDVEGRYSVGGISPGRTLAVVGNVNDCAQPAASIVTVTRDTSIDIEIVCSPDIPIDAISPVLRGVVRARFPVRHLFMGFDSGCDLSFEASTLVGTDGSFQMARLPLGPACLWLGPPKPVRLDFSEDAVVHIDWDTLR